MSKLILFQGDSITDWKRDRNDPDSLGMGYANLVASSLGLDFPEQYKFYNRGISGNRIVDVYARILKDIINLKPDYMSLFVGINDVSHEVHHNNGVKPKKFEKLYTMLLEEIFEDLPDIKIMILSPFVLKGSVTVDNEKIPDKWTRFKTGVNANIEITKRIADKFGLPFINLQSVFDKACETVSESYLTLDGVHPTPVGHEIIKREWLKCFENLNK